MKIIFDKESTDSIKIEDINKTHIVVGIIEGHPVILSKEYYVEENKYKFLLINCGITYGNNYSDSKAFGIQNSIKSKNTGLNKFEVFEQKDWKKALQWLIDNGK